MKPFEPSLGEVEADGKTAVKQFCDEEIEVADQMMQGPAADDFDFGDDDDS